VSKAPLQIVGAVVGVAADTTGTVIAAPFRVANSAVGGNDHDRHHGHDHSEHSENQSTHSEYAQEQPAN
jgi:hypothetical protein